MTTEELARLAGGLKAQSIRAALCRDGHYFGMVPARLPNGRLSWPDDALKRLLAAAAERPARKAPTPPKAAPELK